LVVVHGVRPAPGEPAPRLGRWRRPAQARGRAERATARALTSTHRGLRASRQDQSRDDHAVRAVRRPRCRRRRCGAGLDRGRVLRCADCALARRALLRSRNGARAGRARRQPRAGGGAHARRGRRYRHDRPQGRQRWPDGPWGRGAEPVEPL